MPRSTRGRRRLRVSALATMTNPSAQRTDVWHHLDDATQQLAAVHRADLNTTVEVRRVRGEMDRLAANERFWLYPRAERLGALRAHLNDMDTVTLAEQTNLTARLLEEYGERAALFDDAKPLPEQELVARATQQQFYTVLLADYSPVTSPDGLTGSLHALRLPTDDVQYQILRVTSVEDAITAVALNGEIQAAIIRHDRALRSHDRLPLMSKLLGVETIEVAPDRTYDWVECGQWIRELRPRIDLYLLTDEIGCRPGRRGPRRV